MKNGWHVKNYKDSYSNSIRKYDVFFKNGKIVRKLLHGRSTKRKSQSAYFIIQQEESEINKVKHYFLEHGNSARSRKTPTRPVRFANEVISFAGLRGIDFGCGHSVDLKYIESLGGECIRYDSTHAKLTNEMKNHTTFDFIIISYVFNVVPLKERKIIANTLWKLLKKPNGFIIVGVREDYKSVKDTWKKYLDGYITPRKTFQTFFHEKKNRGKEKLKAIFPNTINRKIGVGTYLIKWRN